MPPATSTTPPACAWRPEARGGRPRWWRQGQAPPRGERQARPAASRTTAACKSAPAGATAPRCWRPAPAKPSTRPLCGRPRMWRRWCCGGLMRPEAASPARSPPGAGPRPLWTRRAVPLSQAASRRQQSTTYAWPSIPAMHAWRRRTSRRLLRSRPRSTCSAACPRRRRGAARPPSGWPCGPGPRRSPAPRAPRGRSRCRPRWRGCPRRRGRCRRAGRAAP
mmetsp:Transcript_56417/g.156208  ORF Transcript_56417/g.156208 Transcript_56417/m.156208 type:complete len:221 (-) Transcript_56417:169-831(-)